MGRRIEARRETPMQRSGSAVPPLYLGLGSLDGERRNVDSQYVETLFRHPDCIRAGTCTDLKSRAWRDHAGFDELDEQRLRFPGAPGQVSCGVTVIP